MGSLLTLKRTFEWENSKTDRSESIKSLNTAILLSKQYKDELYKTSDFDTINLSWGNFVEFIFTYGYDEAARLEKFPWMSQNEHVALVQILVAFKNTGEQSLSNIEALRAQLPGENCGYIGFRQNDIPFEYVSCTTTLNLFHSQYASQFDRNMRVAMKDYFKRFYKPELKRDLNQINKLIEQKRVNPMFKRIDKYSLDPVGKLLHGEQIQMHFNDTDKSALSLDGTWKHGGFVLSGDVCDKLIEWGFVLPENR